VLRLYWLSAEPTRLPNVSRIFTNGSLKNPCFS
jgi:hypothetical protein